MLVTTSSFVNDYAVLVSGEFKRASNKYVDKFIQYMSCQELIQSITGVFDRI